MIEGAKITLLFRIAPKRGRPLSGNKCSETCADPFDAIFKHSVARLHEINRYEYILHSELLFFLKKELTDAMQACI